MRKDTILSIDSLKFICALMVVCIHVFFVINPYVKQIYLIAVPIFYMITGYFLLSDNSSHSVHRIKKNLKKAVRITIVANIVYAIINYLVFRLTHYNFWELILFGDAISGHLWYLTALIESLIVLWVIKRFGLIKVVPYIIIAGLILNLIFGSYYWLFFQVPPRIPIAGIYTILDINRNFFTTALPFMLIGGYIGRGRVWPKRQAFLWVTVFIVLTTLEYKYVVLMSDSWNLNGCVLISTVFLSIAVFQLFLNLNHPSFFIRKTSSWGQKYSLDIYIYHMMVKLLLIRLMLSLPITFRLQGIWLCPLIVVLSIGLSYILNHTIRKWLHDRTRAVG